MENILSRRKSAVDIVPFEFGNTESVIKIMMRDLKDSEWITFDVIKIPTGGSMSFEISTDNLNESETFKDIKGIIIEHKRINAYWESEYSGKCDPPDCYSDDAEIGDDSSGTLKYCKDCKFNMFGSADNGRGKKCKNMMKLYIMLEQEPLPVVLVLPPTSIKNFNDYLVKRVAPREISMSQAVTKITLIKAKSKTGIVYSQVAFSLVGRIENEASIALKESLQPLFAMKKPEIYLVGTNDNETVE